MLAVLSARGLSGKASDDDVRPERAHDADDIADHLLMIPGVQRLLEILGISKVNRASEELPPAVEPPGGQKLLRADDTQLFAKLRTKHVLPAIATGDGEICHPI